MKSFERYKDRLFCEDVALDEMASKYGTPLYVYSRACIEQAYLAYQTALADHDHLICYAVKANSNLAILSVLAKLGAGFDIVSLGELERVIAAGGDPAKVVFSGVCKTPAAMKRALEVGIHCFNVESEPELDRLSEVAQASRLVAPISLRVNPDVDAQTHPYIATGLKDNKFGVELDSALRLYRKAVALPGIKPIGIDCHIGSQILDIAPFTEAMGHLIEVLETLKSEGIVLQHIDLGGGLGIPYGTEDAPEINDYVAALTQGLSAHKLTLILEPGRSIVAEAGVLLTEVMYLKPTPHKNFALVDAAMNDLLRPALYGAWQDIVPLNKNNRDTKCWDIVGPVCETGDFLGKDRNLSLTQGDVLAVMTAGAYGFVMASNYNTRPRSAEVMVDGGSSHLIRAPESLETLWADECLLPEVNL
ncbi:MAG: diaminopimelate decarboxylase [Luminiphilus sp.]|nr:diaminopimelate decarboxylase [Luminiphilus sp.]